MGTILRNLTLVLTLSACLVHKSLENFGPKFSKEEKKKLYLVH